MEAVKGLFNSVWKDSSETPTSEDTSKKSGRNRNKKRKAKQVATNPKSSKKGKNAPKSFKKVVKKKHKVPYIHDVKVPVTTKTLVKSTKMIKVRTTVVEEQLDYEYVTEKYTVMETRKGTRPKEIWVKKIIYEDFEEEIPVTKYRRVKKPVKKFIEREIECEVEVPSSRVAEVKGFRIDQVEDTKEIEVDEVQEFEYVPKMTHKNQEARGGGKVLPGDRTKRILGRKVYPKGRRANDVGIDLDSIPLDETHMHNVLASPTKAPMPIVGEEETLPLANEQDDAPEVLPLASEPEPEEAAQPSQSEMERVAQHIQAYAPRDSSAATPATRRVSPMRRFRHLSPKNASEATLISS